MEAIHLLFENFKTRIHASFYDPIYVKYDAADTSSLRWSVSKRHNNPVLVPHMRFKTQQKAAV